MSGLVPRILAGVVVVAIAVLLFLVLQASDDEAKTASDAGGRVPTIVVEGGEPRDGVQDLTYFADEAIRFRVRSDVADEVHLHGYDVGKEVEAGGTVGFDVPATIEGIFEVELEDSGRQIAEVTVEP